MISGLFKVATKVAMNVIMSMASEKFIEWLLFYVAKHVVESTKTKHDDVFYKKLEELYRSEKDAK